MALIEWLGAVGTTDVTFFVASATLTTRCWTGGAAKVLWAMSAFAITEGTLTDTSLEELADTGAIEVQRSAPLKGNAIEPTSAILRTWRPVNGAVATRRVTERKSLKLLRIGYPCVFFMPSSLEIQNQGPPYAVSKSPQFFRDEITVEIQFDQNTTHASDIW
jgi:hypothetical protein